MKESKIEPLLKQRARFSYHWLRSRTMTAKARDTGENTHKMAIMILIIGSMGISGRIPNYKTPMYSWTR